MHAITTDTARVVPALALAVLASLPPAPLSGQSDCPMHDNPLQMQMLLEKTIFNIDVLWLTVRIDGDTATQLRAMTEGRRTEERADSIARLAVGATCADVRLDFVRDVGLDRFFESVRQSLGAAREAGFIEPRTYRLVDESLPEWYAFLEGRGIRDGDRMTYELRGDTVNTRYHAADGDLLLDQTDVGADRRRSVLAGYFAPGTDFRDALIENLFAEETGAERSPVREPEAEPGSAPEHDGSGRVRRVHGRGKVAP